jgi:Ras-related protein Rab-1A
VDFQHRIIQLGKNRVKLNIWDTAGQEQHNTITTAYYRGAEAVIIVYDVTNQTSLKHVSQWVRDVERFANEGSVLLIMGNKVDLAAESEDEMAVPTAMGEECAKSLNALFFETSAKEGTDIDKAFEAMAVKLIAVKGSLSRDSRASTTVALGVPSQGDKSKLKAGCC